MEVKQTAAILRTYSQDLKSYQEESIPLADVIKASAVAFEKLGNIRFDFSADPNRISFQESPTRVFVIPDRKEFQYQLESVLRDQCVRSQLYYIPKDNSNDSPFVAMIYALRSKL